MEDKMKVTELNGTEARAVIMGCACVITSRLTPEQLGKYCVYHPEALRMTDEEGKVLFTIDIGAASGRLTEEDAVFSNVTTPDGRATITILIDPDCGDKQTAVLQAVGEGFARLDALEEHLVSHLPDLEKEAAEAWDIGVLQQGQD